MARKPTKVLSSSSEHLGWSYPERDMGLARDRWRRALCFRQNNMPNIIKPKIVIVEDEIVLCEMYRNGFEKDGFEVKIFNTAEDIVEKIIKEKPDIISMDIILPGINGYKATELLKNDPVTRNIPIIGFDTLSGKEDIKKAVEAGMTIYLLKSDWTPSKYIEFVRNYLGNPENKQVKKIKADQTKLLSQVVTYWENEEMIVSVPFKELIIKFMKNKKLVFIAVMVVLISALLYWNHRQTLIKFHACRETCIESPGNHLKQDYCSAKCTEKYGIDLPW